MQESLLFISDAYQQAQEPIKSNEHLSNILEAFGNGTVSDEIQERTLRLVIANLAALESYEDCISYQVKLIKLCHGLEDKINVYQEIANNFLQLNDHQSAIEN